MRGRIYSSASFVSSPKFKAQTLITSLLLRDHLLMEIMTADEIAGTFSAVTDALDIRAHTVAHPRRNRIHIQYNLGPLWLCLSFYNLAFFLLYCVSDSVSSRSLSKPTPCRRRGPPQSQVRGTKVSLSPFCHVNSRCCLPPLALYGVVFHLVSTLGFTMNPTPSGQRETCEERSPSFLFFV